MFCVLGDDSAEAQARLVAGARGPRQPTGTTAAGTVVTTGCTDWTYGLVDRDADVERITRDVIEELG